ncbi:STAS domain-containing protein [Streptomyces rhizosphaerihabitans]|uniref:STAS domain-containing protein n=1 Tax=Streptomyces rhizosphaerihabitans TaxID=1266770 RepID=UPI0021C17B6A|nr:STAS domain-containing protein [Streptomyces rhizosphaerihabitans]MCT9011505.1 STAS domain-containing protein [Streptomyces rhizosphaerihabitans]
MDAPHAVGGAGAVAPGKVALEVSPLPGGRSGIRARGEISALTRPSWEQALTELARRHAGVSYVELADVVFVDVAGVSALAITAMNLPGGRVVVEHPPPQLPRVLEMFWPGLDRIEVVL